MTTIQLGCRACGGDLFARRSLVGARDLKCGNCGVQVPVAPVLQVWPFSAAVAPAAAGIGENREESAEAWREEVPGLFGDGRRTRGLRLLAETRSPV